MARGNGRQAIFHAVSDYQRMTDGLAKTVGRTGWQVFVFVSFSWGQTLFPVFD